MSPAGRRSSVAVVALSLAVFLLPAAATASAPRAPVEGGSVLGLQEPVEAQEEEHAAEEEDAEGEWWEYPARWVNFAILAALLYWALVVPPPALQELFTFPGLKVIVAERAASIIEARDLAVQQREEAERLLSESEQRLGTIEEEVAVLLEDARADAERERERADVESKEQVEKVVELARRGLDAERVAAQQQLRRYVADLAVGMAEKSLKEHLTADDQDRLIRDYLARIGESMA